MANDTILIPGGTHWEEPTTNTDQPQYLERDLYLSGYTETEQGYVRNNLNVPSVDYAYPKNEVYTKEESDEKLDETIRLAFVSYLNEEDPHGILPLVLEMIANFVKTDGSTPFTAPLKGVDPIEDFHLATKRFVKKILNDHINSEDPHKIIPIVRSLLEEYVKQVIKNQLYTKDEINSKVNSYVQKNGTTPFTKPQEGVDPEYASHLSTKRYVDNLVHKHTTETNPHGFVLILNNRLASYAKSSDVYNKNATYSKTQLDSIINNLVGIAAQEAILEHLNEFDPHDIISKIDLKYVKHNGSVPFTNPQKGKDAVDPQDLVTLHQVEEKIALKEAIWKTPGFVETTVGFVEDNSSIPEEMTLQLIMDAIFFGKRVSLTVPEYVTIGDSGDITVCVHNSIKLVQSAVLYLGENILRAFDKSEFEDGCITVQSNPIYKDTTFTFRIEYTNGTSLEESKTVTCSYPTFVGLLPKWKFANTVDMEYLERLVEADGTNNKFLSGVPSEIVHKYKFSDSDLKHIFLVVPASYSSLESMLTKSLSFGTQAFDIIDMIPLLVEGHDVIYKMYVYRQTLSSLDQEIVFKFEK